MENALLYVVIGVLIYVAFFRKPMAQVSGTNTSNTTGNQQLSPQSEFDRILALISKGLDTVGNVVSNTSTQRN